MPMPLRPPMWWAILQAGSMMPKLPFVAVVPPYGPASTSRFSASDVLVLVFLPWEEDASASWKTPADIGQQL